MAAGPGVRQMLFEELPLNMQEAAQRLVAEGRVPNISSAVNFILDNPEYIEPEPMETSRKVALWVFGGAAAVFGGALLYYLLRDDDDRESNPDREEILGAVMDVLPVRGAMGINEIHEAAKNAFEARGWGLATWSRDETDAAVDEGIRLYIIDEVPGGYARAAGRRRIPVEIQEEGILRRQARHEELRRERAREYEEELRKEAQQLRKLEGEEALLVGQLEQMKKGGVV